MEVGKGRVWSRNCRDASAVVSEDTRVRGRQRCYERVCWHPDAEALNDLSKCELNPRTSQPRKQLSLRKFLTGWKSGWVGRDEFGVRMTSQCGGRKRSSVTADEELVKGSAGAMQGQGSQAPLRT